MKLPQNTHVLSEGTAAPEGAFVVIPVSMIREREAYEEAGQEPAVTVLLPFAANVDQLFNVHALTALGINAPKFAAQCDQLLKENTGNNWKAKRKAALAEKTPRFLGQPEFDELYANYDFSGVRTASSAEDLSDEEVELRRVLRDNLKEYLREGNLLAGAPKLTIQMVKEAKADKLPVGKFPLAAFEELVEAAASRSTWTFDWTPFGIQVKTDEGQATLGSYTIDFGAEPQFTDLGQIANHAAIVAVAETNANEVLATKRKNAARMKPAALAA